MNPIDYFTIAFRLGGLLTNTLDPSNYIEEITGDINAVSADDSGEKSSPCGRIKARLIQLDRALNDGQPKFDVFDSIDQELADYYAALFDPKTDEFHDWIQERLEPFGGDILLVDNIQVLPEHRGKRVGQAAMLRTIETFGGGAGLVAIKPFPLQHSKAFHVKSTWDQEMKFDSFSVSEDVAFKKLQRYWGQLGFKRIPDSDFFALSLSMKHPTLKSLGLEDL